MRLFENQIKMTAKKKKLKSYSRNIIAVLVVVGVSVYVAYHTLHIGKVEFTDNAQIKQHVIPINSRIRGYIKEIRFEEYQKIKKGDTLILIDDSEFRLKLNQENANYQKVNKEKSALHSSFETTKNNILISEASIKEAVVKMENAEKDFERYEILIKQGAVSREKYDKIKMDKDIAKAQHEKLIHQKKSYLLSKDEHAHYLSQQDALIELAKVSMELAHLNFSYTVITAPCDGVTGRKNIQEGQLVEDGQTLVNLVNKQDKWITANFRESQIRNIHPGSLVEIKVDAFPNTSFLGMVKSISDATGSSFSLIPQDNSTGNFVKVQQRIPVRIEFSEENDNKYMQQIRSGMNVECLVKY